MQGRVHTDPLTPEATKRSTFVFLKAREPERTGIPHLLLSEVSPCGLEGVRGEREVCREGEGGREKQEPTNAAKLPLSTLPLFPYFNFFPGSLPQLGQILATRSEH